MAFEKMGDFTFNHADQADELNLAADTAKQKFDSRASELKTAINKVVDLLNATTDGASGADNVGATAISGVTGTTVQAQMESMKGLVDGKAASGHDHDSSYASASHDHDSSYAPIDLAGTGRTTETVKGNADDLAAHLADTTTSATQPHGLAKNKLDATVAPTVTDDSGDGYGINSVWIDVTADKAYVCLDATAEAAVWKDITVTANPTVPCARVYHDANQSIAASTATVLAFNTERYDTDSIHDNSTNNTRLTCKTAGDYDIKANITWDGNATGYRVLMLRLNGSTIIARVQLPAIADAGIPTTLNISTTYNLTVNDYVEVMGYHTGSGSLNVLVLANYSPEFMMEKVG